LLQCLLQFKLSTPADALKNIADALGISADALLSDNMTTIKDKELLKKFEVIQEMSDEEKSIVLRFLDLSIRDFKTRKTYVTD
jgi:ABC-type histidine transport system ATPase subunit